MRCFGILKVVVLSGSTYFFAIFDNPINLFNYDKTEGRVLKSFFLNLSVIKLFFKKKSGILCGLVQNRDDVAGGIGINCSVLSFLKIFLLDTEICSVKWESTFPILPLYSRPTIGIPPCGTQLMH